MELLGRKNFNKPTLGIDEMSELPIPVFTGEDAVLVANGRYTGHKDDQCMASADSIGI